MRTSPEVWSGLQWGNSMEERSVRVLWENFRRGLLDRRDFIHKVVLSAGGAVAASQVLKKLGFEPALIREAEAHQAGIVTQDVPFPSGNETVNAYLALPAGSGPFPTINVIPEILRLSHVTTDAAP